MKGHETRRRLKNHSPHPAVSSPLLGRRRVNVGEVKGAVWERRPVIVLST